MPSCAAIQRQVPASPAATLPVFNDATTFHLNGQTIHAFHIEPAHTDSDSVLHFKEVDVIYTGDVDFNGRDPFIDTFSGGSVEGMLVAADQVLALATESTKIIPGHG
ncbi:MAG: MBL fold metallo-hydrolase, partial [Cyanobacteria bacterium P01_A01_bin.17]